MSGKVAAVAAGLGALAGGCQLLLDADRLVFPASPDGGCAAPVCAGRCGLVDDGCGATDCGGCAAPDWCGGGGTENACGCAESDEAMCARLRSNCGARAGTDVCGRARAAACGSCPAGTQCGAQGADNVCGCTAQTCTQPGRTRCVPAWRACTCETCAWRVTRLAQGEAVGDVLAPAVALERAAGEAAQVVWYDNQAKGVRWVRWPAAGPEADELVEASETAGTGRMLALDADDRPHVAFPGRNGTLKYGRRVDGAWHLEIVDGAVGAGHVAWYLALALDAAGAPRIAYDWKDGARTVLRVARRTGTERWERTDAVTDCADCRFVAFALDAQGRGRLAWQDRRRGRVLYATEEGRWRPEVVDDPARGDGVGVYLALALDGAGRPHLAYNDRTRAAVGVRHAVRFETGWSVERVDEQGDWEMQVDLAVDRGGATHLAYGFHYEQAVLRYGRWVGDGWSREEVPTGAGLDPTMGLALDARGQPVLLFAIMGPTIGLGLARWGP